MSRYPLGLEGIPPVNLYDAFRKSNRVGAEIPGRFRVEFLYTDRGVAVYRYTNLQSGHSVDGMMRQCEYELIREGGDPFALLWEPL